MKKLLCLALSLLLALGLFAACGEAQTPADPAAETEDLSVVCSIFPIYDYCRTIMGSDAALTLLLDSKTDLHNYSPTTEDILKIADADLFIYVGGESDDWVADVLNSAQNQNLQTLALIDMVNAVEEELLPGMEPEEEEAADEAEGPAYDEHVWTSLKNAQTIVARISETLCALDPANAAAYTANTDAYLAQLAALEQQYAETIAAAKTNVLVFADRYPFRYLADDYGLLCYGAFAGCSAESEASFETMTNLVEAVQNNGLHYVLQIEGGAGKVAETVAAQSGAEIRTLNSCQSVSLEDIANGTTYLSIMEDNLAVLQEVLN